MLDRRACQRVQLPQCLNGLFLSLLPPHLSLSFFHSNPHLPAPSIYSRVYARVQVRQTACIPPSYIRLNAQKHKVRHCIRERRVVSARALIHVKDQPCGRAPKRRSLLPTGVDSLLLEKRMEPFLFRREITAPGRNPFSVQNVCTDTKNPFGKRNVRFEKDKVRYKFLRKIQGRKLP